MLRRLGVVCLCLLLAFSLFGTNLAMGIDRGPLDRDHMTSSAEDVELYTHLQGEVIELLIDTLPEVDLSPLDLQIRSILERVVTPEWMQAETERNVDNAYDFFHGGDTLELYLDASGLRDDTRGALEETLAELQFDEPELEPLTHLRNEPEQFEEARSELRREIVKSAGFDPDEGYGHEPLARLIADEETYEQERDEARDRIAEEIMIELDPAGGFGLDTLEEMLESEENLEREQESFREARKEEIQEESDRHMSDEELEEAYQERLDDIIEATANVLVDEFDTEEAPPMGEPHIETIAHLTAEALATDMSHETFTTQYDEAVVELETDVVAYVHDNSGEFADELNQTVQAELKRLSVPEPVEPSIEDLGELIVAAITTDMPYDEFIEEYETIATAIDDAAAGYIWVNVDEYDLFLQEELDTDDVPASIAEATDDYVEALLAGILTDVTHDEFLADIETHEEALADTLVTHLFESGDGVPDRFELTQEVNEQAGDQLALAQSAVAVLSALVLILPALSLAFLGGVYLLVRDVGTTALALGVGGILGGGGGYLIAALVPERIADDLGGLDLSEGLIGALQALVHAVFAPLGTQSAVLIAGGTVLTLGGLALHFDFVDRFRDATSHAPTEGEKE